MEGTIMGNRIWSKLSSGLSNYAAIIAVVVTSSLTYGQVDIINTDTGPIITLARNATWAMAGVGGSDNAFLFNLQPTTRSLCFAIVNNHTVSKTGFSVIVTSTMDPGIISYLSPSNHLGWALPSVAVLSSTDVVLNQQATLYDTIVPAGARGVISFSGGEA